MEPSNALGNGVVIHGSTGAEPAHPTAQLQLTTKLPEPHIREKFVFKAGTYPEQPVIKTSGRASEHYLMQKALRMSVYSQIDWNEFPFQVIEVDRKSFSTKFRHQYIYQDSLSSWLERTESSIYGLSHTKRAKPSFRLLVADIDSCDDDISNSPFPNKYLAGKVTEVLDLSRSFCYYSLNARPFFSVEFDESGQNVERVCLQTPCFASQYFHVALTVNSISGCVSGYLRTLSSDIIASVKEFQRSTSDPLLLPTLIFERCVEEIQEDLEDVDLEVWRITHGINHHSLWERADSTESIGIYEDSVAKQYLKILCSCRETLNDELVCYTFRAADKLRAAFQIRGQSSTRQSGEFCHSIFKSIDVRMEELVALKVRNSEMIDAHTEILCARIQEEATKQAIELQQCGAVQSANDTKSAQWQALQMKTMATINFFFMPTSAVAAFFGICSFFKMTDEEKELVHKNMWIFWASAGPLTLTVILAYFTWIYMDKVQTSWKKYRKSIFEFRRQNRASSKAAIDSGQVSGSFFSNPVSTLVRRGASNRQPGHDYA